MNSQQHYTPIFTTPITPTTESYDNKYGSFVPPLPSWNGGQIVPKEEENFIESIPSGKKRGGKRTGGTGGGRKPNNNKLNPEEDERRQLRRERNKLAAARCRKRRVDYTDTLLEETEQLESTKLSIQKQITELQSQRDELEFILQAHNSNCSKVKGTSISKITNTTMRKQRPTTLPVPVNPANTTIQLSTPSRGFDLDWDDLPSTGLTPTATTASTPMMTPSTVNAILNGLSVKSEFVDL